MGVQRSDIAGEDGGELASQRLGYFGQRRGRARRPSPQQNS